MNAWLRWMPGRQGTGYAKLLLARSRWPIRFDAYLLRYRMCAYLPLHTDPVEGHRHYRLNITLRDTDVGGNLLLTLPPIYQSRSGRVVLFRSDTPHMLSTVLGGPRLVLSIGVALPARAGDG